MAFEIDEKIDRYVQGLMEQDEREIFSTTLSNNNVLKAQVEERQKEFDALNNNAARDFYAALQEIAGSTAGSRQTKVKKLNPKLIKISAVAATIVLLIATAYFMTNSNFNPETRVLAYVNLGNQHRGADAPMNMIVQLNLLDQLFQEKFGRDKNPEGFLSALSQKENIVTLENTFPVEIGLMKIRALIASGKAHEARKSIDVLSQSHPNDCAIKFYSAVIEKGFGNFEKVKDIVTKSGCNHMTEFSLLISTN